MSELNLILIGPPGAGKGTQGRRLESELGLPYVATGDIVRAAIKAGNELGRKVKEYNDRGDLVPDEVMIGVIAERIGRDDCAHGFVLDGFPRTIPQGEALDAQLRESGRSLSAVLLFEVGDEEVVRRISGRRSCEQAGHVYNIHYDPPRQDGVCDRDASTLEQREDDQEDKVRHRLDVYRAQTAPLAGYYEGAGTALHRFDGAHTPEAVQAQVTAALSSLRS